MAKVVEQGKSEVSKKTKVKEGATKAKKEWGVILKGANPEAVQQAIFDFLEAHEGVLIHPKQDMAKLIEQMIRLGYCPCKRDYLSCPHPNVETQIKDDGKCLCALFVTEAYLKQYYAKEGNEWLPVQEVIAPYIKGREDEITLSRQLTPHERAELRFVEPHPRELAKGGKLWVAEGVKPVNLRGPFNNYEELRSYIGAHITQWNKAGIPWQSFRAASSDIKEVQSYAQELMERLRGGPA